MYALHRSITPVSSRYASGVRARNPQRAAWVRVSRVVAQWHQSHQTPATPALAVSTPHLTILKLWSSVSERPAMSARTRVFTRAASGPHTRAIRD